mmetsp:Transcript_60296/g.160497  ORF Transcript_60296/g.160497 Transcript_60296/m.160497 type:complete len:252 (-) Transcript_60296:690-1445(-)
MPRSWSTRRFRGGPPSWARTRRGQNWSFGGLMSMEAEWWTFTNGAKRAKRGCGARLTPQTPSPTPPAWAPLRGAAAPSPPGQAQPGPSGAEPCGRESGRLPMRPTRTWTRLQPSRPSSHPLHLGPAPGACFPGCHLPGSVTRLPPPTCARRTWSSPRPGPISAANSSRAAPRRPPRWSATAAAIRSRPERPWAARSTGLAAAILWRPEPRGSGPRAGIRRSGPKKGWGARSSILEARLPFATSRTSVPTSR